MSAVTELESARATHREPADVEDYRLAREAQMQRFDDYVGGGLDRTDTGSTEYRAYFGVGEYAGSGVEERLTYRAWLHGSREPQQTATEWLAEHPEIADAFEPEPSSWDIDPIDPADRADYLRMITVVEVEQTAEVTAVTALAAFRMSGAELATLAQAGDGVAAAEIARRVARRAAKHAAGAR